MIFPSPNGRPTDRRKVSRDGVKHFLAVMGLMGADRETIRRRRKQLLVDSWERRRVLRGMTGIESEG